MHKPKYDRDDVLAEQEQLPYSDRLPSTRAWNEAWKPGHLFKHLRKPTPHRCHVSISFAREIDYRAAEPNSTHAIKNIFCKQVARE